MKIIAFGASSSRHSINKRFAQFTANQFRESDVEMLDLNDFPLPLFSVDEQSESGFPANAIRFYDKLRSADLIIISLAEHNGSYTSAFKNLFDWLSRFENKFFSGRKLFLLSTSTGARGGLSVMESARMRFPKHGAEIAAHFSLPDFDDNFDPVSGISGSTLKNEFNDRVRKVMIICKM
jgi:NAD(P)H-dependent FMN reductase